MTTLLIALWAFFTGVFVGLVISELLTQREKRTWPLEMMQHHYYHRNGHTFYIRCKPGRFERLCNRMEDSECQGNGEA